MNSGPSAVSKALDAKKCVVELIQWEDAKQQPMFAYLLLKKTRLAALKAALAERNVDIAEFGVVVAYGSGSEPPAGFEASVLEAIKKVA
jgi:hypothetical protein